MNLKPDIKTMLIFYSTFVFPLGLTRLKYEKSVVQTTGFCYKIFAMSIIMFVCVSTPRLLYVNFTEISQFFQSEMIMSIISIISQIFSVLNFFIIITLSNFMNGNVSKEMYETLIEIDGRLRKSDEKSFDEKVVVFNIFFIMVNILQVIMSGLAWPKVLSWPFHILVIVNDMELVRFMFEINLVSKRFETLNNRLKIIEISTIKDDMIDLDMIESLIQTIWKSNKNYQFIFDNEHFDYLKIHSMLSNAVEMLNSIYSLKV